MLQAPVTQATGIVIVGVGGQGILLASEVLARAAMLAGHQVKTNEVHGMAQRGGSVMAQIRYGPEVFSPLITEGTARVLVAFEKVEAIRAAHFLAPSLESPPAAPRLPGATPRLPGGGLAIVSKQEIVPVTVSSGQATYPTDIDDRLRRALPRLILLDAVKIAADFGEARAANIVIVGALSAHLDLPPEVWEQALARCVKPKHLEINQRAFEAGRKAGGALG